MGVCSCSWLGMTIPGYGTCMAVVGLYSKQSGEKNWRALEKSNLDLSRQWECCIDYGIIAKWDSAVSGLKVWRDHGHLTPLWYGEKKTHSILRQTWDFGLVVSALFYMDMDLNCFYFHVFSMFYATLMKKRSKEERASNNLASSFFFWLCNDFTLNRPHTCTINYICLVMSVTAPLTTYYTDPPCVDCPIG